MKKNYTELKRIASVSLHIPDPGGKYQFIILLYMELKKINKIVCPFWANLNLE